MSKRCVLVCKCHAYEGKQDFLVHGAWGIDLSAFSATLPAAAEADFPCQSSSDNHTLCGVATRSDTCPKRETWLDGGFKTWDDGSSVTNIILRGLAPPTTWGLRTESCGHRAPVSLGNAALHEPRQTLDFLPLDVNSGRTPCAVDRGPILADDYGRGTLAIHQLRVNPGLTPGLLLPVSWWWATLPAPCIPCCPRSISRRYLMEDEPGPKLVLIPNVAMERNEHPI